MLAKIKYMEHRFFYKWQYEVGGEKERTNSVPNTAFSEVSVIYKKRKILLNSKNNLHFLNWSADYFL